MVDVSSVLTHAFSPAARARLVSADGWETINAVAEWTVLRQRDAAAEHKAAERMLRRDKEGDDDMLVSMSEDKVRDSRADLEAARREKKALFANLFAGACAALSDHLGGGGTEGDEWWVETLGRTRALGRLHWREINLDTVEMVAEGNELGAEVRSAVFGPLRQLEAYTGGN